MHDLLFYWPPLYEKRSFVRKYCLITDKLQAEVKPVLHANRRNNSNGTLYSVNGFVIQNIVELSKPIFHVIKRIVIA